MCTNNYLPDFSECKSCGRYYKSDSLYKKYVQIKNRNKSKSHRKRQKSNIFNTERTITNQQKNNNHYS